MFARFSCSLMQDYAQMYAWSAQAAVWGLMLGALFGLLWVAWNALLGPEYADFHIPGTSPRRIVVRSALGAGLVFSLLGSWAWLSRPDSLPATQPASAPAWEGGKRPAHPHAYPCQRVHGRMVHPHAIVFEVYDPDPDRY